MLQIWIYGDDKNVNPKIVWQEIKNWESMLHVSVSLCIGIFILCWLSKEFIPCLSHIYIFLRSPLRVKHKSENLWKGNGDLKAHQNGNSMKEIGVFCLSIYVWFMNDKQKATRCCFGKTFFLPRLPFLHLDSKTSLKEIAIVVMPQSVVYEFFRERKWFEFVLEAFPQWRHRMLSCETLFIFEPLKQQMLWLGFFWMLKEKT